MSIRTALVTVQDSEGRAVGNGFLALDGQIITCAHVWDECNGVGSVQFRNVVDRPVYPVKIAQGGYFPVAKSRQDGVSDIAILKVVEDLPNEIKKSGLSLARDAKPDGTSICIHTYLSRVDEVKLVSGSLGGLSDTGHRWIVAGNDFSQWVQKGTSGSAVFTENGEVVEGIVSAIDKESKEALIVNALSLRFALDEVDEPDDQPSLKIGKSNVKPIHIDLFSLGDWLLRHPASKMLLEQPKTTLSSLPISGVLDILRILDEIELPSNIHTHFDVSRTREERDEKLISISLAYALCADHNANYLKAIVVDWARRVSSEDEKERVSSKILRELFKTMRSSQISTDARRRIYFEILNSFEKSNRNTRKSFYPFVEWILNINKGNSQDLDFILDALLDLDADLSEKSDKNLSISIKNLIAKTSLRIRSISEENEIFYPGVVKVNQSRLIRYELFSSITPITNFEWYSITSRGKYEAERKPMHPYTLSVLSESGEEHWNLLSASIDSFVETLNQSSGNYFWDVPTVSEWLALSSCEDQPYPWGHEPPTPERANLNYDIGQRSLKVVGRCPTGATKDGVQDACGNVHEVVRVRRDGQFPEGFRLAGGCFQNAPMSCQFFRKFKRKRKRGGEDNRQNVGIRLVRIASKDIESRNYEFDFEAMEERD